MRPETEGVEMIERSVVLSAEQYGRSAYYLRALIRRDGALVIEGHDLGDTPERFWGSHEYEWEIAVAPEQVPALVQALGGPDGADPLELLVVRFREGEQYASRAFLEEHGIPFSFWSRIGD